MSIILQQQHYSESQLMELKVSDSNENEEKYNLQLESMSRSFLHVLSDISSSSPKEKENVYIHPLSKWSSSSKLNEKSLELCTENLGSETGTDIMDSKAFIQSLESDHMENPRGFIRQQQVVEKDSKKKMNNSSSRKSRLFPPPLTTLSGEKTIRVTTHRESGRLVIKAVAAAALNESCFQAQRSHGRLRLCYLNYEAVDSDHLQVKKTNNENVDELENINDEFHNQENDDDEVYCNQMNKENEEEKPNSGLVGSVGPRHQSHNRNNKNEENENENEIEIEIEKEKFQRIGRCKEGEHGNNGLCNWESFWVAIS